MVVVHQGIHWCISRVYYSTYSLLEAVLLGSPGLFGSLVVLVVGLEDELPEKQKTNRGLGVLYLIKY